MQGIKLSALLCVVLAGCATKPVEVDKTIAPNVAIPEEIGSFDDWKTHFKERALASGADPAMVDQMLARARLEAKVVQSDQNQEEFIKMPWQYLQNSVSDARIRSGQKLLDNNAKFFNKLEKQYGVPKEIIVAIWGMESSYGKAMGNQDLINALATLAYEGRRRDFAEKQLIALLKLLQRGDVQWDNLKGSWAGGMGHTQFIPETFLYYGVDGDGDGIANPWDSEDALASTANYFSASHWNIAYPWGYEVKLAPNFSDSKIDGQYALVDWRQFGASFYQQPDIDTISATLYLPAGIQGPAFLLTPNFAVIRVYNNSYNYALAVGILAQGIAGEGGIRQPWPMNATPLRRNEVVRVQEVLNAKGFNAGKADGIIGQQTMKAFRTWQKKNQRFADGFITRESVQGLL